MSQSVSALVTVLLYGLLSWKMLVAADNITGDFHILFICNHVAELQPENP